MAKRTCGNESDERGLTECPLVLARTKVRCHMAPHVCKPCDGKTVGEIHKRAIARITGTQLSHEHLRGELTPEELVARICEHADAAEGGRAIVEAVRCGGLSETETLAKVEEFNGNIEDAVVEAVRMGGLTVQEALALASPDELDVTDAKPA